MSKSAVAINIQIGHTARVLTQSTEEGYTHEWSVCVQGQDNRSITQFVEKVVFILHESFKKPRRTLKNPPFKITERGYGGFNLPVEIYFRSNCEETRKTRFEYDLFLQEISGLPINHIRTERVTFFSPLEEFRKRLLDSGGEIVTCEAGLTSPSSLPSNTGSSNTVASVGGGGGAGTTSASGGGTSRGIRSSTTSSVSADSGAGSAKQNSATSVPHKASAGKKTKSAGESGAVNSSAAAVKKVGVETSDLFVVVEEIEAVTDFNEVFRGGTWLEASAKLYLWAEDKQPSESSCREALRVLAEKHRYGTVSRYIATVAPMRIHEFSYEAILQTDHISLKAIDNAKKILQAVREFFASASDAVCCRGNPSLPPATNCNTIAVGSVAHVKADALCPGTGTKAYGSSKVVVEKLKFSSLQPDSSPSMKLRALPYEQEHSCATFSTETGFHSEKNTIEDLKKTDSNSRQAFNTDPQFLVRKKNSTNSGRSCVKRDRHAKHEGRVSVQRHNRSSEMSPPEVHCENKVPASSDPAPSSQIRRHSECPSIVSSKPTSDDVPKPGRRLGCESGRKAQFVSSSCLSEPRELQCSGDTKSKSELSLRLHPEEFRTSSTSLVPTASKVSQKFGLDSVEEQLVIAVCDESNSESQAGASHSTLESKRFADIDVNHNEIGFHRDNFVIKENDRPKVKRCRKRGTNFQQCNLLRESARLKKERRGKEQKIVENDAPTKQKSDAHYANLKAKELVPKNEPLALSVSEKNCDKVSTLKSSISSSSIGFDSSTKSPSNNGLESCARSVKVEPRSRKTVRSGMEDSNCIATDAGFSSTDTRSCGPNAGISATSSGSKQIKSEMNGGAGRVAEQEMKKPDNFITLFGEPLQPYKDKSANAAKAKAGPAVKGSKAPLEGSKAKDSSSLSKDKTEKSSSKSRDKDSSAKERKPEDKKEKKDKERDKAKSSKNDKKSGDKEKSDKSTKHKDSVKKEEKISSKDNKKSSKNDKEKKDSKDKHRDRDKSTGKENLEKGEKQDKSGHSKTKDNSSKKSESSNVAEKKDSCIKSESKSSHESSSSKSHRDKNDDKRSKSKESSHKSSSSKEKLERSSPKPDLNLSKKEGHSKHKSESSKSSSYSKDSKSGGGSSSRSPGINDQNGVTPPVIVTTSPAPGSRPHGGVSSSSALKGPSVSPSKEDHNPRSSKKRRLSPSKKPSASSERSASSSSPSFKPSPSPTAVKSGVGAHSLSPSPSSSSSISKHSLPPPLLPPSTFLKVSPSQITSPKSASLSTTLKVTADSPRKKKDPSPRTVSPCDASLDSKKKKKRSRKTPERDHLRPEPVTPAPAAIIAAPVTGRQNEQSIKPTRSRSRSSSSSNYSRSSSLSGSDSRSLSSRSRSKSRSRSRSTSSVRSRSSRSASPSSGNPSGSRSASASASPSRSRSPSHSAGGKSRSPSVSSSSSTSPSPPPRTNNLGVSPVQKSSTLGILLDEVSSTSDSELEMPPIKRPKVEKSDVLKECKKSTKGSVVLDASAIASTKTAALSKKESNKEAEKKQNASKDTNLNRSAPSTINKEKFGGRAQGIVSDGKYSNDDDNSEENDDASEDEKILDGGEVPLASAGKTFSDIDFSEDEIGETLSDSEEERIFEEGKSYVQSKTKENGELELSEYPDWYFNESRVFYLRRSLPRLQRLQLDVTIGSLRARQFGEAGLEALRRTYGCLLDNNVAFASTELGNVKIEWRNVRPSVLKKVLNIFKEYTKMDE